MKGCVVVTDATHPDTHRPSITRETSHTHRGPQKRLERLWGPQEGGTGGSVGQLDLDMVDQPSQRDVDPARHLLVLEDPDVVRDLGNDVASQPKSITDGQIGGEAAHQRTRILVSNLLLPLDVTEHESHHGLGLEAG